MEFATIRHCKVGVVTSPQGYMVFGDDAQSLHSTLKSDQIMVHDFDKSGYFVVPKGQFESPPFDKKIPPSKIRELGRLLEQACNGKSIKI